MREVGVRWTVGDVSLRGWEALRLSVWCAWRLFGPEAGYVICVNSVALQVAQDRTGQLPEGVRWRVVERAEVPGWMAERLDGEMAEGVGWKLVPAQVFPERWEIALDNDCLVWAMPEGVREFLGRTDRTLMAEDVDRCLGIFDAMAPAGTINSGIRGLPPGFDLTGGLRSVLDEAGPGALLRSELDEQGLQAATLGRGGAMLRVRTDEVSICSPFWPRQTEPGTCGAHFVGLNSKSIPWNYYDRPGLEVRREHWDRHRAALYERAGLEIGPGWALDAG